MRPQRSVWLLPKGGTAFSLCSSVLTMAAIGLKTTWYILDESIAGNDPARWPAVCSNPSRNSGGWFGRRPLLRDRALCPTPTPACAPLLLAIGFSRSACCCLSSCCTCAILTCLPAIRWLMDGRLGDASAVPLLMPALSDTDETTAARVATALGWWAC